jgi:hypothetical protein
VSSKARQSTAATASRTPSETSRASTPSAVRKPPPQYGVELVDRRVAGGQPLDPSTRASMESKFGHSFAAVRVHDDAHAHASARALHARAYTLGNDIVFAAGQYRRDTPAGVALLAHELAHTVQQAGVQRKADGPAPESVPVVSDPHLEAQADRAALAVTGDTPMPALSQVAAPAILRDDATTPPPPVAPPAAPPPPTKLPPGMTPIVDIPPGVGSDMLIVSVPAFTMPKEKGKGAWVQAAYDEAAAGGRLVFSPVITTKSIAAYKEDSKTAEYLNIWLRKFGFKTTQELAAAFVASTDQKVVDAMKDAGVNKLITGMKTSLSKSGCDIDHIVEKQFSGTSIPNNLQLLDSKKNQDSGRETYGALKGLVEAIRDPSNRGNITNIQLRFQKVTVPTGTDDPSFVVEGLLRAGVVKGANAGKLLPNSSPVLLTAGNVNATAQVLDKGECPIDGSASRVISGVRLTHYTRGALGVKSPLDSVKGELDSRAIVITKSATAEVILDAHLTPAASAPAPAPAPAASEAAASTPAPAPAPSSAQIRTLELKKSAPNVPFYYPYLSPGRLTKLTLDDKGFSGSGEITPTVAFLGKLEIVYGPKPDQLALVAPLDASKLKSPIPSFRFTKGALELALSPKFIPKGTIECEIGPAKQPLILGKFDAKLDGGAFVVNGKLTPGKKIPGITAAEGNIEYHSAKGWSGKLTASSSSIPKSTTNVELGFLTDKSGALKPYAKGGITTKIRDSELVLNASWDGNNVGYWGSVTIPKPLPGVESVKFSGSYANDKLSLTGETDFKWRSFSSKLKLNYNRKDGEEGKFSGSTTIVIETEKAEGELNLNFNEAGGYWGKGEISYQVSKNVRPKLGIELTPKGRVKLGGEVVIGDIPLTKMWPSDKGGNLDIVKGIGVKFSVPTPVPGVTAFGQVTASLSLGYGIGPVMLEGVKFNGELYPLEDDPKIKAKLTGKLSVPGYGELKGTFGAKIGAEVLLGAAGVKGGLEVSPALRITGKGVAAFDAAYEQGGFDFSAEAYAEGSLEARLGVDLSAGVYGLYGLLEHTWTYPLGEVKKQIGPTLRITFGKIAYSRTGEITWPSLSQIKVSPEKIEPLQIVKDLMSEGKVKKA